MNFFRKSTPCVGSAHQPMQGIVPVGALTCPLPGAAVLDGLDARSGCRPKALRVERGRIAPDGLRSQPSTHIGHSILPGPPSSARGFNTIHSPVGDPAGAPGSDGGPGTTAPS